MPVTRDTLIHRLQAGGDEVDWEEFFTLYRPFIYNVVRRWQIAEDDACDIVQDVFVTLIRAMPRFEYSAQRGRFRGWLKTIVQHVVIDWLRRRGRRNEVAFDERLLGTSEPDDDWLSEHREHVFQTAVNVIRDSSRPSTWSCFEEHLLKGRRAADVADDLGLTSNAVYVNAARTLDRIRKHCLSFDEDLGSGLQTNLSNTLPRMTA